MYRAVLLLFVSCASAQVDVNKTCNFTQLLTPFNVTSIAGAWYQLERIENTLDRGDCSTITLTVILNNGFPVGLEFSSREVVGGELFYRNATVTISMNYVGALNFTFNDGSSYDYAVIGVTKYEYESMVLYSCQDIGNRSLVWVWKLGKHLSQSPEATKATEKFIARIDDITNATWRKTSFSDGACKLNDAVNLQFSSPLFLLVIFMILQKSCC